jgi:hydrogenase maturation protease
MAAQPTTHPQHGRTRPTRTLVLGLGNPLLWDDSVGLRVIQTLRPRLLTWPGVELDEECCGGLCLMERMIGFDRALLIDAMVSGAEPGTIQVLAGDAVPTQHSASAHDVNLGMALALGRQAGAALPAAGDIRVVAIEAADCLTFSAECTRDVKASIGRAAETVLTLLSEWR